VTTYIIRRLIQSGIVVILVTIFVFASYNKILAPADFAKIIYGYDLFPPVLINLIAIIVPFLEFIAGLALIIGFYLTSYNELTGIILPGN